MHQLHDGARAAGYESALAIAWGGKAWRVGGGSRGPVGRLYPMVLERLWHSRFHRAIEALFPHDRWTDRAFRAHCLARAHIVHVHSFTGYATPSSLAFVARRKPTLWTLHCYWGERDAAHVSSRELRLAAGLAPQLLRSIPSAREAEALAAELEPLTAAPLWIVSPSAWVTRCLTECPNPVSWRVRTIHNGIDPGRFRPGPKGDETLRSRLGAGGDGPVVLVVNRDFKIDDKGFPIIREALGTLGAAHTFRLALVGQNAGWAAQRLAGNRRKIPVEFVADRTRMAQWYEGADIFLFASRRENFPCVTLEAMAAGCCVVATPTDGVTEQIRDGIEGLLSPAIDGTALAGKLRVALDDPALRLRLGHAARERVAAEFSEERMVHAYLALYDEMVASGQKSDRRP